MTFSSHHRARAKAILALRNKAGNFSPTEAWEKIKADPHNRKWAAIYDEFCWDKDEAFDRYNVQIAARLGRSIKIWADVEEGEAIPLAGSSSIVQTPYFVRDTRENHAKELTPISRVAIFEQEADKTIEHYLGIIRNQVALARSIAERIDRVLQLEAKLSDIFTGIEAGKKMKRRPRKDEGDTTNLK